MASTVTLDADSADDLNSLLAEQRVELTAAQSLQSDLDFAFRLQFEEAISASLANLPSSSSAMSSQQYNQQQPPPQSETVVTSLSVLQEELTKTERELADGVQARLEMRKTREDLDRLVHDQLFVKELSTIPDDEWSEWGDEFENPYGQGRSTTVFNDDNCEFRLYFKGLVSQEKVRGKMASFSGIGVTICGPTDNVVFELKKPLIGDRMSKNAVEIKALIEGLNAALALELKRLRFFTDYYPLYQFITGRWPPKQRKIAVLVNQVYLLRRKFQSCNPVLVACNDLKYGLQLARDAIVCQATKAAESSHGKTVMETCVICLEDTDVENMFEVDGCLHRYCFSCMKRLVENKLLQALVPKCPHEGCKSELKVDSCRTFLTPKLLETYEQRIREASIPVMEKVYCPYPKCSALMTRSEVLKYAVKNGLFGGNSGTRKCLKCQHLFCVNCKVPWHENMSCYEYKRLNPNPPTEDVKLKSLASKNLWRQCVKCNHMIELSEGCFHMTCRCGYEFCYNCGAEWKNKKATCSCPLWDEDNIWFDDRDIDSDEEEVVGVELYESDSDEDWHPVGEEGEGQDLWVKERDDQDLREEEGDEDMSQEDDSDFPQDVDEKVDYDDYDDDLGGEEGGNQDLDEEEDQDLDEEEDDNDHDQDLDFSEEDDNDFPQDVDVGEKADYDENDSDDYDGDLDGREGKNQDLDEEEDRDLDEEEDENDHDQGLDFSEEDDYDDYDDDLDGDYDDEYW